jgi:hypothetical protein
MAAIRPALCPVPEKAAKWRETFVFVHSLFIHFESQIAAKAAANAFRSPIASHLTGVDRTLSPATHG